MLWFDNSTVLVDPAIVSRYTESCKTQRSDREEIPKFPDWFG